MIRFRDAALLCAAVSSGACASGRATPPHDAPAPPADAVEADRALLSARRSADSLQVVIASIAIFKAVDPDVRRLAQTIVTDHLRALDGTSFLAPPAAARRADLRRGSQEPTVSRLKSMAPGPDFDVAFVDAVLEAHRHDERERRRLLPRIGGALRQLLDSTQPMLELHLRLAEAVKRGFR